jgi:hypothetical protein
MFSPMRDGQPPQLGRYLVVPPTAWPTAATGPVIDEARLLKDLTADMVWGVETVVEGGSGLPWPGRERDRAGKPTQTPTNAPPDGAPPLKYALHSPVPASWIPFVPVSLGQNNGFTLQRAIMPGDVSATITPAGRILRTTSLREQTVSTEGTVISRLVCRSRWIDGSTHLWIARRRTAGLGQGNSGLRFDLAVPSANP